MIVTTFAMPTDDAPFSVGASLVSFSGRATMEWFDKPDGNTFLVVTHRPEDTKRIEDLATGADREVELVSSVDVDVEVDPES